MTAKKFIMVGLVFIAAFTACNKENSMSQLNPKIFNGSLTELSGNKKAYSQKMIEIDTKKTLELIKNFKERIDLKNNLSSQARLIEADSVELDSSIFVLEAALNYEFDYFAVDTLFEVLPLDTFELSIPIVGNDLTGDNNGKVNSEDLENVYTEMYNYISSRVSSSNKVRVIDIEPYISSDGLIYYKAVINMYWWNWIKLVDCSSFAQQAYATNGGSCASGLYAVTLITDKLLRCQFVPCPSIWYFNVSFHQISNDQNSYSFLHFIYINSGSFCDPTQLSPAQMMTYVNNINSYAFSIKPANTKIVNCDVSSSFTHYGGSTFTTGVDYFWVLKIWWGQPSYTVC